MTLLFRVIYATHANGTHHKLALDALNKLEIAGSEDWRRLFLKHAELYMQGSKAPDKDFKDFKNHVLHPGDTYWGGAPEKARGWYTHLVQALKDKDWSEAVWCAGVLSHYYTDPIHPFHTAQSDAESAIHRAVEWSINKSYNDLYALGTKCKPDLELKLPKGEQWIEDFVCQGADTSHEHYERLIAHYDINVGASDPPAGLDDVSRTLIAGLLIYASTGFARIIERAITEANVEPPQVNLSVSTVLATLKIPLKWVLRKIDDEKEREAVQAQYDELMSTGSVDKNLSQDDRTIRDLYAKEVLAPRRAKRKSDRRRRVSKNASKNKRTTTKQPDTNQKDSEHQITQSTVTIRPAPKVQDEKPEALSTLTARETRPPQEAQIAPVTDKSTNETSLQETSVPVTGATALASTNQETTSAEYDRSHTRDRDHKNQPRTYLKGSDPIVDAPAIGPKTAKRLREANLITVDDLLQADPEDVSENTSHRSITAATVADWQDFAQLVIDVPGLRGGQAQLLAGAGFKTAASIADAQPDTLCADVLRFASTPDGNRILRDGDPPDIEKIKSWFDSVTQARAA